MHICNPDIPGGGNENITFQANVPMDAALLERPGAFDVTVPIRIPDGMPAGKYVVRYGFYRPTGGDRLSVVGVTDGARLKGGELHIEKGPDGFTQGRYVSEDLRAADGLNTDGKMLDFGGIVTDGAFRLVQDKRKEWRVIPLPGSRAFRAVLTPRALGMGTGKVKTVEMIDPRGTDAKFEWAQDTSMLHLTCDGRAFAYRIIMD
jgi:hypothetical protein